MNYTALVCETVGSLYALFCGSGVLLPFMGSAVALGITQLVHFCFTYRGCNYNG